MLSTPPIAVYIPDWIPDILSTLPSSWSHLWLNPWHGLNAPLPCLTTSLTEPLTCSQRPHLTRRILIWWRHVCRLCAHSRFCTCVFLHTPTALAQIALGSSLHILHTHTHTHTHSQEKIDPPPPSFSTMAALVHCITAPMPLTPENHGGKKSSGFFIKFFLHYGIVQYCNWVNVIIRHTENNVFKTLICTYRRCKCSC